MPFRRDSKLICPEYLKFVRARSCCACGKGPPSDPDHLIAQGRGQAKRNDFTAVSLCRRCHTTRHQIGTFSFDRQWRVNLWQEMAWNLLEFFQDDERRVGIEIQRGKI